MKNKLDKVLFGVNFSLPYVPIIVYLIYIGVNGLNMENNILVALITGSIVIVAALIGLIGTIITTNRKRPKLSDTDNLKKDAEIIKNDIGHDEKRTLFGQHDEIIDILEKELKSSNSPIIENLKKIEGYVTEENLKNKYIGSSEEALISLKNTIFQNSLFLEKLDKENSELLNNNKILNEENSKLKKELDIYKSNDNSMDM